MVAERIIAQIFIVIVLLGLAFYLSYTFLDSNIEVVLLIFGMLVGICAILELVDDYYYTLIIILFILLTYRFSHNRGNNV